MTTGRRARRAGPSSAGYSGRTLVEKLGIKEGDDLAFVNAPDGYQGLVGKLPDGVTVVRGPTGDLDFVQLFISDRANLEREFPRLKARLRQDGRFWVSWPKASSKIATDLSDAAVKEVGLRNRPVDVKVCAIDESWSALKFVRRLTDRRASSIGA